MKTDASVELIVDWSESGRGFGAEGTERKPLGHQVSIELPDELKIAIAEAIRLENKRGRGSSAQSVTNKVVAISLSLPVEIF